MLLLDIPVIFICPDHNEKYRARKNYMFDFLYKLGFKNVTMFKSESVNKYPKAVAEDTYNILSMILNDEPFLLLEDDIELSEWAHVDMQIEIPEDTDAFYLGFGRYGGSKTDPQESNGYNSASVIHISDSHIKLINVLDTHAVLYISKRYKQAVMNEMKVILDTDIPMISDVIISRIQENYNVYAYKYPFFFQTDKLENPWYKKDATNFRF